MINSPCIPDYGVKLQQPFWPQGQVESSLIRVARDPAEAFGETLSIAVITAGTDFRATGYRIPRSVSPLYCSLVSHDPLEIELCYSVIRRVVCRSPYVEKQPEFAGDRRSRGI